MDVVPLLLSFTEDKAVRRTAEFKPVEGFPAVREILSKLPEHARSRFSYYIHGVTLSRNEITGSPDF